METSYVRRGEFKNPYTGQINHSFTQSNGKLAIVAMPRGSKPGERRGGRQRGTPNKKTVLRNAAISAGSADPNISPLDFLLGLMKDPNLPLEYRVKVAMAALPFVHTKAATPKDDPAKMKHRQAGEDVPRPPRMKMVATCGAVEGSPLAFLMEVMRNPDAPPHLRVQVARAIAPYVHCKSGVSQPEVVIDDEYGFVIDPAAARALRDDKVQLDYLIRLGGYLGTEAEHKHSARIAEKERALAESVRFPPGYTELDACEDGERVSALRKTRVTRRPYGKLTAAEDAEEAHAMARLAVYRRSP